MESEKCRVLLCAIDKGSITAAAEAMGYTISGVSRMMAALEKIPASALAEQPFILLDKAGERDKDVMQVFERAGIVPKVRFTTLDDYAVMSMVEHGLGVSILPKLILRRIPYRVALRPLAQPVFRQIGLATRQGEELAPAARRFLTYLSYRDNDTLSEN